jgi:signal transduction histidine kinase
LVLSGVLKHYDIEKNMCETTRYVKGDRNLLEQVFRNLEINAVHAMPEGGKLTLETQFSRDEHFFEVKISDTGSGIPKEIQAKIFEPFFTTKAEGVGTGLGLPIVKDIIEKHKGYIDLESEKDQGTIVTVGIPIVKSL